MTRRGDTDDGWGPWPDDSDDDIAFDDGPGGPRRDAAPGAGGDRVERGVETLQAAARELIKAARAVLDVAEEVVDDPEAVVKVVGSFTDLARGAVGDWAATGAGQRAPRGGATDGPRADERPDDNVEHIPVD